VQLALFIWPAHVVVVIIIIASILGVRRGKDIPGGDIIRIWVNLMERRLETGSVGGCT
jgi:hypothetical protein